MKIKADLHNHFSTFENIGENIFDRVIDVAQKNLGKDGIFGVINAQDKGIGRYETFMKQAGKNIEELENAFYVPNRNIYVIKGQEVFTQGGHILVLGLNHGKKLQDYRTLEDSFKEAKDNNGIIILDHPCFKDGVIEKNPEKYLEYLEKDWVDGMEVHNGNAWLPIRGCIFKNANKKAQDIYKQIKTFSVYYDIGAITTSDGHSINEIGMSYTWLEKPSFSSAEILKKSLRKSIREHKDFSQDKQTNAYLGTLDHAVKVVGLRIASKLRIIGRIN